MTDFIGQFHDFLAEHGLAPVDTIHLVADGKLHRYRAEGDKPGHQNAAYVLHGDSPISGFAQSWRTGLSATWTQKSKSAITDAEWQAIRRRAEIQRAEAEREQANRHADARSRAQKQWTSYPAANPQHAYLQRKMIQPGNARQYRDSLVLAVQDVAGTIHSLQFIATDGVKILLRGGKKKGCFVLVHGSLDAGKIYIAEGFATASSLAELAPNDCHIAAIDAGNLEPVAVAISKRYQKANITIAADTDEVGMSKARKAAIACGGKMAVPPLSDEQKAEGMSDWNDMLVSQKGATNG